MTDVQSKFRHVCPVSFNKFDTSIEKVVNHTFGVLSFDRSASYLPTYIGVQVEYTADLELINTIRQFFERLRGVHQRHFVRFVTDTVWAMNSHNGDIFYSCDGDKDPRVDVLWNIKAVTPQRIDVTITNTTDNRRRELLTHIETKMSNAFVTPDNYDPLDHLQDIVFGFFSHTKNITALEFLQEDCHIVLTPSLCGRVFRPILLCGLSRNDAIVRWRGIKGQLEYQKHMHTEYFTNKVGVGDLLNIPLEEIIENGFTSDDGFCARTAYNAVEQTVAILHATSAGQASPNDIIIFCQEWDPKLKINTESYALRSLAAHA